MQGVSGGNERFQEVVAAEIPRLVDIRMSIRQRGTSSIAGGIKCRPAIEHRRAPAHCLLAATARMQT